MNLVKICKILEKPILNSTSYNAIKEKKADPRKCSCIEESDGQYKSEHDNTTNVQNNGTANWVIPQKQNDSKKIDQDCNKIQTSYAIIKFLQLGGMTMASLPNMLERADYIKSSTIIHYALYVIMGNGPTEDTIKEILKDTKEPKLFMHWEWC